jgi:hypothetical protein
MPRPEDPFDAPVPLPVEDTLDLHTFHPKDVGMLVPDWLEACRDAGFAEVRLVHGKGRGVLAAGVRALLDRSPLVRNLRADGNWGGVTIGLWPVATDEARVRDILLSDPHFLSILDAVATVGPPGAWVGAGAVRNRVWHALHRREGPAPDTDLDVAWHGGREAEDTHFAARLSAVLPGNWEVVDQGRYGAATAEAGIARWPETATCVAARRVGADVELLAAHGWGDVIGMVVRRSPGTPPEVYRARLTTKQWRRRFPWVRVEP